MVSAADKRRPDGPANNASMEPCLFRHGKCRVGSSHPPGTMALRLQWSHVFSDMVRTFRCCMWITLASMEPCLFRHGKRGFYRAPGYMNRRWHASMEPCLFRHGKESDRGRTETSRRIASMEPCLFRHGKDVPDPDCSKCEGRCSPVNFWQLQWSHVFSDMVSAIQCRTVIRAT
jgi:hypothetical protein